MKDPPLRVGVLFEVRVMGGPAWDRRGTLGRDTFDDI